MPHFGHVEAFENLGSTLLPGVGIRPRGGATNLLVFKTWVCVFFGTVSGDWEGTERNVGGAPILTF